MVVVCHFLPLCSLLFFFPVEICFIIIQRSLHLLLVSISGFCPLPAKLTTSTHPRAKFRHPSLWICFFLFFFLNKQNRIRILPRNEASWSEVKPSFVSLIPTPSPRNAVYLPFSLECRQLAEEQLGKKVQMTWPKHLKQPLNFFRTLMSFARAIFPMFAVYGRIFMIVCNNRAAKQLWQSTFESLRRCFVTTEHH